MYSVQSARGNEPVLSFLCTAGSDIVCSDGQVVKLDRSFVLCPSRSEILLRTTVTLPVATLPALRRFPIHMHCIHAHMYTHYCTYVHKNNTHLHTFIHVFTHIDIYRYTVMFILY